MSFLSEKENKSKADIIISPQISAFSAIAEDEHDVFEVTEDGPDFRGLSCIGAAVLIAKTQFGLGVLGLPQTFQTLGFVPGLFVLIVLCAFSTWTGLVVGKFRLRHPHVYSIGDAMKMMFGKWGEELIGGGYWLLYDLCSAASVLTVSIALNTLSGHALCTTGWVAIGCGVCFLLGTFIRTMKVMSWCGYVALTTVFSSVWIVAIACLAQKTPAAAPVGDLIDKGIHAAAVGVPFAAISSAIGTQVLGLCGIAAFFSIHSEMRDQTQYVKSLFLGQGFVVFNYIVVSCIIYGKVGKYVTSPALGSAGLLIQKICYGIALPALLFSCFFQAHLAGKYTLVRILRGTKHLQSNSVIHWTTWLLSMVVAIAFGFVVASAIPFFDDLLALIGALFGASFTLTIPGMMVLFEICNHRNKMGDGQLAWLGQLKHKWRKSTKSTITTVVAFLAIACGVFIMVAGTYGAVQSIINGYKDGTVSGAFSCDDNSR